ncbi:MAG: TatD family hydrolase, partial [Candidatus Wildermuthbacteria bacterium]|nr:TatD family hydrolase [Candidatus Wildermuthbacteria bacterium]
DAKRYFDLEFLISFTGTIAFPPKKGALDILAEVAFRAPLNMIMVETDSPYLAPPPHRGARNEPSYVEFVARRLAEIKGVGYEQIAEETTKNAVRLFNLKI